MILFLFFVATLAALSLVSCAEIWYDGVYPTVRKYSRIDLAKIAAINFVLLLWSIWFLVGDGAL